MAALPPDLSPLQIGTHGEFDGLAFTLLGRVRFAYDEGSWNEWFALFSDNRYGWVAEAQGFFMVSFEYAPPESCVSADDATTPCSNITVAILIVSGAREPSNRSSARRSSKAGAKS
jgi:hypothetical protein